MEETGVELQQLMDEVSFFGLFFISRQMQIMIINNSSPLGKASRHSPCDICQQTGTISVKVLFSVQSAADYITLRCPC